MKNKILASLLLVLIPFTSAFSDIYKCKDPDGVISFSDVPCSEDAELAFKNGTRIAEIQALLLDFSVKGSDQSGIGDAIRAEVKRRIRPVVKKIGDKLFPLTQFSHFNDDPQSMYSVKAVYTSLDKHDEYSLSVHYSSLRNIHPDYIFKITYIRILKNEKFFYPDVMYNADKLKKLEYGKWEVHKIQ